MNVRHPVTSTSSDSSHYILATTSMYETARFMPLYPLGGLPVYSTPSLLSLLSDHHHHRHHHQQQQQLQQQQQHQQQQSSRMPSATLQHLISSAQIWRPSALFTLAQPSYHFAIHPQDIGAMPSPPFSQYLPEAAASLLPSVAGSYYVFWLITTACTVNYVKIYELISCLINRMVLLRYIIRMILSRQINRTVLLHNISRIVYSTLYE